MLIRVLMKSRLSDVPAAIRLSRATLTNIHQNLFWAFFYNVCGIPLAAGCFIKLFGWALNPMFGAAAMSLSSFFVVSNALRLNLFRMHDPSKDRPLKNPVAVGPSGRLLGNDTMENAGASGISNTMKSDTKENETMASKTINIEGMMCKHCEKTVKGALEALDGVSEAVVSHEAGTAVVTLTGDVSDDTLKKAVEDKDYTVTGIA